MDSECHLWLWMLARVYKTREFRRLLQPYPFGPLHSFSNAHHHAFVFIFIFTLDVFLQVLRSHRYPCRSRQRYSRRIFSTSYW